MDQTLQVSQAAAELVAAFASNDTQRYFACFSEDASFVFHTLPQPLFSRQQYQTLWQQWQADGFKVLDCQSSNASITLQGELAIFIHDVDTRISLNGEEQQLAERETILFRRHDSRWLACHEHLSVVSPA
ncbi:nuclear transport factor 2 family protein [Pseudomonas plecoglossicida]|uniref:YybH family protein n=1 Tax=Pseudomonas plecoglossicida TaxID=70775 RepID=UPI0015E2AC09|nr:nuclear transport factor 2 family protein [Pseudomonas plecoglossicida]MBA1198608.1 nuclear transport factor 2 family protein [Pseudomonas plecoglossicida]